MRYFADKIVYDKYEPENTNVVWVQPTEEGAQIKAYVDGEWQLIGYDHDAYRKPASGIPESDLEESVRNAIDNAQHLDGKIDAEIERSEGVDASLDERLGIVEQLADISISGGDATIATASDFNNPTAEQKAYIPTVGAILDGADTTPTSGSGKLVTSGGVYNVINSLKSAGYVFAGVATTSTNPGTPTEKVFYIGGAGTYANFGTSVTVPVGSICVFKYNGSWTSEILSDGLFQKIGVIDSYWELVVPNITTGALTLNGTNRIGYVEYIPCHAGDVIESEYQFIVLYYTEPTMNSYVLADSKTSWNNNTYTFAKDGYFRVALRYSSNNENITEEMKEEMIKSFAYSGNVRYIQDRLFKKVDELSSENALITEQLNSTNKIISGVPLSEWVLKTPNVNYGTFGNSSTNRLCCETFFKCSVGDIVYSGQFGLNIFFYTSPSVDDYSASDSIISWDTGIQTIQKDGYVRFFMRYSPNNEEITDERKAEMVNTFLFYGVQITKTSEDIKSIKKDLSEFDFGLTMKNYRYKIGSIEREETNQCVIGLLGDSWTQHNGASYLANHSNYVQPIASYLRNKYGNAGGGFYSFSISHIGTTPLQKMASVDPADADDERSATGITYQDQTAGVKGIDAADAVFGNGTYLTLNVLTQHNKFVIHFWGASEAGTFTYSLDGASPVSVDASQYTGHSTIEISTTDTTHTLRFDVTSGSVMLFGVDMQRTASGVRVHKFGNKGATSSSFVNVDADAWKAFVQSFNLDSMTLLLGMNDGPNATTSIYNNLKTIIGRIKNVNQFCDLCVIAPAGGKNYDFTEQAAYQETAAKDENIGYINLIKLFGDQEQITAKNTFVSDGIHPTLAGGRMIADYIIEKLFP